MVDGDVGSGRANVAPLAQLKARYGVWAAPGNHEYYSGYDAWMAEFRRLGLNLLENRMQLIDVQGARLALSGIGDPAYGRDRKSTRLNSSHLVISYAVFCLQKKQPDAA